MKKIGFLLLMFVALQSCKSCKSYKSNKTSYLEKNRYDLNSADFDFPEEDFKIVGFGAYHGSAKTEKAEHALLQSLAKNGSIKYYIIETDFSIGHYFNEYLNSGDTLFLKNLVEHYGIKVPQDRSIETYKKWKELKVLNDNLPKDKRLTIVGIDEIVSYKYTSKHLLETIHFEGISNKALTEVVNMVKTDTTDFSPYYDSYSKAVLKNFVSEYLQNPSEFETKDQFIFDHIISNLQLSFAESSHRETTIFNNYTHLSSLYRFEQYPQFLRYGFFHIEKEREGNKVPFFAMLIENNIYKRNQVLSVIGYLTESNVLWDVIYDDEGNFETFTTEGGFGIGDYEKEYFRGIENLKNTRISDMTLFQLNKKDTPYSDGIPDLIEIVMTDEESNGKAVKGKSTTDYLDYAVLISSSEANTPIEEME